MIYLDSSYSSAALSQAHPGARHKDGGIVRPGLRSYGARALGTALSAVLLLPKILGNGWQWENSTTSKHHLT